MKIRTADLACHIDGARIDALLGEALALLDGEPRRRAGCGCWAVAGATPTSRS